MHRVKGMEWPYVVVLGAHDGLMPHALADDIEEERRIFHVAITRGDTAVHVVADATAPRPVPRRARASPRRPNRSRPARAASAEAAPRRRGRGRSTLDAELGLRRDVRGVDRPDRRAAHRRGRARGRERRAARRSPTASGSSSTAGGRSSRAGASADITHASPELVDALKAWRKQRAASDRVPAYIVLSDAHLEGIADRRPESLAELARCTGIGPTKLERYGDEIIAVIADRPPA